MKHMVFSVLCIGLLTLSLSALLLLVFVEFLGVKATIRDFQLIVLCVVPSMFMGGYLANTFRR